MEELFLLFHPAKREYKCLNWINFTFKLLANVEKDFNQQYFYSAGLSNIAFEFNKMLLNCLVLIIFLFFYDNVHLYWCLLTLLTFSYSCFTPCSLYKNERGFESSHWSKTWAKVCESLHCCCVLMLRMCFNFVFFLPFHHFSCYSQFIFLCKQPPTLI